MNPGRPHGKACALPSELPLELLEALVWGGIEWQDRQAAMAGVTGLEPLSTQLYLPAHPRLSNTHAAEAQALRFKLLATSLKSLTPWAGNKVTVMKPGGVWSLGVSVMALPPRQAASRYQKTPHVSCKLGLFSSFPPACQQALPLFFGSELHSPASSH